jgi:hypothetical protein
MVLSIRKANGQGRCHNCNDVIPKGKNMLIVRGFGWADRRICRDCVDGAYDSLE